MRRVVRGTPRPDHPAPLTSRRPTVSPDRSPQRLIPDAPPARDADPLAPDVWGFADTRFTLLPNGSVSLTGTRYAIAGQELPELLPWVERVMDVTLPREALLESQYPPAVPAARPCADFLAAVRQELGSEHVSQDPLVRLRHGHGQTLEEMYRVKHDVLPRVPDVVVFPGDETEVVAIVDAARAHGVSLIPYGGGTNVTDALRCPDDEARPIASVDLSRMNRIRWIDRANQLACIEAGAVGRHIQSQLAEHGLTLGHEPDSVEFSTLGGWIATHASGMKKNRYGNIEDIVLDVHAVTPMGVLARTNVGPRESIGVDVRRWMLGSEGMLGIITHAIVRVFPLPDVQRHEAILFPSFEDGFEFLRQLTRAGTPPASVRLVDNLQFQLSQTLKPRASGVSALVRRAQKWVVTGVRGFEPDRMVACTLVFEGSADEVARQEATVRRLAKPLGGMRAGAENGRKGYELTFGIAYIRDFVMRLRVLGESFETSVSWSDALALCERVKQRVVDEHALRGLPGRPFVTCRITQLYQTGVAVYFYLGFSVDGVADPLAAYLEIEHAARDEILNCGGSLSHHHGIGKIRRGFLSRTLSPAARAWTAAVKHAVDPENLLGAGNQ
jgi:alkyldihydroxyacetonephosphate synthase